MEDLNSKSGTELKNNKSFNMSINDVQPVNFTETSMESLVGAPVKTVLTRPKSRSKGINIDIKEDLKSSVDAPNITVINENSASNDST